MGLYADYSVACGLGDLTTPHHTTPHHIHYTIYIYTPLDTDLGQNPVPAKKPCKPVHRSENYFSKWVSRCSVVTSMLTPPSRNHNFFYKFSCVLAISHTFSAAFRCRKTIENAKDIYNFSKQVVISLQRGDIDVHTSHTKSLLFFVFFRCLTFLIHIFFPKNLKKHRLPKLVLAWKPCKPHHRSFTFQNKYAFRSSVVTSMCVPPM